MTCFSPRAMADWSPPWHTCPENVSGKKLDKISTAVPLGQDTKITLQRPGSPGKGGAEEEGRENTNSKKMVFSLENARKGCCAGRGDNGLTERAQESRRGFLYLPGAKSRVSANLDWVTIFLGHSMSEF